MVLNFNPKERLNVSTTSTNLYINLVIYQPMYGRDANLQISRSLSSTLKVRQDYAVVACIVSG